MDMIGHDDVTTYRSIVILRPDTERAEPLMYLSTREEGLAFAGVKSHGRTEENKNSSRGGRRG